MKYDFTSIIDRHGMDALAVDALGQGGFAPGKPDDGFDVIPMWIADMNFATAPTIMQAVTDRLNHPAFGYFFPRQEYFDAIIRWQQERNGVNGLSSECIGYENGVLGGVVTAANILCSRGDNILVHAPTYIGFTNCLENNGYHLVHSELVHDADGIWRMDLEDMERKIVDHQIHCAVFCSPHNPCGRVWERWEIEAVMALYEKYDVKVISDEIWSDLILDSYKHTPTQMVSEYARQNTIALYAPSKTFNLAGLIGSYHIIYNRVLRERHRKESSLSHYNSMNMLSMYALIGAYSETGREWLDELRSVLSENVSYACSYIQKHLPGLECYHPQGTYMLFVNCEAYCSQHDCTIDDILQKAWKCGVAIQDGRGFHGACHFRMNLALPLSRVEEAFRRLSEVL